jgi:hypothetical protein
MFPAHDQVGAPHIMPMRQEIGFAARLKRVPYTNLPRIGHVRQRVADFFGAAGKNRGKVDSVFVCSILISSFTRKVTGKSALYHSHARAPAVHDFIF